MERKRESKSKSICSAICLAKGHGYVPGSREHNSTGTTALQIHYVKWLPLVVCCNIYAFIVKIPVIQHSMLTFHNIKI